MKKLGVFLAVFLFGVAHAAQTPVTEISGTQASIGALKSQTNAKLNTIESNRQDHESRVSAVESGKADQSALNAKAPLAGTMTEWTSGRSYSLDDWATYDGKIYKCVTANTSGAGNAPGVGSEWEEFQGGTGTGSTNISVVAGASTVAINSSSGTDATFPAATTIAAGALTAADKAKLDGIAPSATANSSDATLLARANHTGTQLSSTISDFASTVNTVLATPLSKLSAIAAGAEVNVNADWNASSGDAQILNKPSVVATDTDNTYTGQQTFEDIILPQLDTMEFNVQVSEPTCSAGEYKIYFYGTKARQCINGTASDIGSGTGSAPSGTGVVVVNDGTFGNPLAIDTDLSSTSSNDDTIPSAKGVRTLFDSLSASGLPTVTETPADAATGASWYNSTANELCVAEAAGISCVAMTYTADDNDPSNSTPWFTDETDIALNTAKTSNAITLAGLGARGAAISVTGSTGAGYNKNSAGCTSSAGRGYNGDTVAACVTSSASNSTATTATVTIGTDSDQYSVTTLAGVSYLINQNFEGTGYDNSESWTTQNSTIDPDYTATVLAGSQSLALSGSGGPNVYNTNTFTASSSVYVRFMFRISSYPGSNSTIFRLENGTNAQTWVQLGTTGGLRLYHNGVSVDSLSNISVNTTYYIWVRYTNSGVGEIGVSTTSTQPTMATISNGADTQQINRVRAISSFNAIHIYDDIKVSTTAFGSW